MTATLANRAAAIAAEARNRAPAGPSREPTSNMTERDWARIAADIARDWWRVTYKATGEVTEVLVTPAQTQREMQALYPGRGVQAA